MMRMLYEQNENQIDVQFNNSRDERITKMNLERFAESNFWYYALWKDEWMDRYPDYDQRNSVVKDNCNLIDRIVGEITKNPTKYDVSWIDFTSLKNGYMYNFELQWDFDVFSEDTKWILFNYKSQIDKLILIQDVQKEQKK